MARNSRVSQVSSIKLLEESLKEELEEIEDLIEESHLTEEELELCVNQVFGESEKKEREMPFFRVLLEVALSLFLKVLSLFWTCLKIAFVLMLVCFFISSHIPTQKLILRHSQDLIYPVMRQVRLWTLPVLKKYHHLTQWHEEECLVSNPFYGNPSLECWPCEDIKTLVDLTGLSNYSRAYAFQEKPFLVRDVMSQKVTLNLLRDVYSRQSRALEQGTASFSCNRRLKASLGLFLSADDLNQQETNSDLQVVWKMHRVSAARVVRKFFVRPHFVPNSSEVALQRYIFIDGPNSRQYFYPLTDFANVWLAQGQGSRLISLEPSDACRFNCSSLSILLKPRDVLYYNWQFYRPRSLPSRFSNELSITFMGSFY